MSYISLTDAFGRSLGGGTTVPISSGPTIDTSAFLKKEGDSMTGDLDMGNNSIVLNEFPARNVNAVNKGFCQNAENITIGRIHKDRIPQVINGFALEGQHITFGQVSTNNFIGEATYGGIKYLQLDADTAILLSIGRNDHLILRDNKFFLNNKTLEQVASITSNEFRVNNAIEPIIINDSGITLDDHVLRFRGPPDNNNSIRWFNGSVETVPPRLEFSSFDRIRFSTARNKDNTMPAANRVFVGPMVQFIELQHDRLDLNNNRIVNLGYPLEATDAVTKGYVDTAIKRLSLTEKYKKIKDDYSPTFWISAVFPDGFDGTSSTIADLSGTGLTVSGSVARTTNALKFSKTSTITSTATFGKKYTFFLKARRTGSSPGRVFTSSTGNILFGWWGSNRRTVWINDNIIGVSTSALTDDNATHTYMMTSNDDVKNIYAEKVKEVSDSTLGDDTWGGKIVVGKPTATGTETETTEFDVFEVIGFGKVLTETEMFDIYDKIFA